MMSDEEFLAQASQKAWKHYQESIQGTCKCWDYVIITASNACQGRGFAAQLEERRKAGFLPKHTHFGIVPDPVGERVGNGGAMLGAMRYVAEHEHTCDFTGLKILVILSSGDSRRAAQYSALGKIFSPVPRMLPNRRPSTLFDESMMVMSGIPERITDGVMVLSGDVLLAFDYEQFVENNAEALAVAFPEPAETGANHGVFLNNAKGQIAKVWHKQKPEVLRGYGAVDEQGCVNIDTGAVLFGAKAANALFSLVCNDNMVDPAKFRKYVNGHVAPSLYVDFFYPLAEESTFEGYMDEIPESAFSAELLEIRQEIWQALRPFRINLLTLKPSRFIHFGSTIDVSELMSHGIQDYHYLGWKRQIDSDIADENVAAYSSKQEGNGNCGNYVYLENSVIHSEATVGDGSIIAYAEVKDQTIPSDVVLHVLKQEQGQYVARIYGVHDNPKLELNKGASLFGVRLADLIERGVFEASDLWSEGTARDLWNARLYPLCNTMDEAVTSAVKLYQWLHFDGTYDEWKQKERASLESSFNHVDGEFLIEWSQTLNGCKVL